MYYVINSTCYQTKLCRQIKNVSLIIFIFIYMKHSKLDIFILSKLIKLIKLTMQSDLCDLCNDFVQDFYCDITGKGRKSSIVFTLI